MRKDILDHLRMDPGQRTLGQLLQDREAAAHEIERLRLEIQRLQSEGGMQQLKGAKNVTLETTEVGTKRPPFRPGTLIRIAAVCELLGLSRSTIYRLLSEGTR